MMNVSFKVFYLSLMSFFVVCACPQVGVSVGGRAEVKGQRCVFVFGGLVFLSDPAPAVHPLSNRHTAGRIQWSGESEPVRPV